MAENLNLNVNVDTSTANASIGSLKKQLREAQQDVMSLADKFGATSKQAIEAAKKAADLKDRIGDAKALTDAYNPDQKFKALTASLSGVAGGFGAVQGAMALFGAESEDVQKTLLKVQSAMAISQGLNSIGDSIDSFKTLGNQIKTLTVFQKANEMANKAAAFSLKALGISAEVTSTSFKVMKTAIISTGIGVLVIGLGEAVAAFQNFQNSAKEAAEAQAELNKKALEFADLDLDAATKSLANRQKVDIAEAKAKGKSAKEIFDIEENYRQQARDAQQRHWKEIGATNAQGRIKDEQDIKASLAESKAAQYEFDAEEKKRIEEKNKANAALRAQQIADELAAEKALQEALLQQEIDAFEKRQEERKRFSLEGVGLDGLTNEERTKKAEDDAIRKEFFDKKAQDLAEQMESDGLGKILAIKAKGIVAEQKQDEDNLAAKKRINDLEVQAKQAQIETLKGFIGNLGAAFEQGTVASKTAAIAEIGINTALGYIQGLDIAQKGAKGTGPLAPFTMPIFYASQILAVVGAVSKAKQALSGVKGGGGVGGSITPPSLNTASPMSPQIPTAQTTNISQQSINQLGNQAVKAYVIESDVTGSQQRIEAIRQRARFS